MILEVIGSQKLLASAVYRRVYHYDAMLYSHNCHSPTHCGRLAAVSVFALQGPPNLALARRESPPNN